MDAVDRYRMKREKRLGARGIRTDTNYRLPFGLCQREGIEIGKDWSPSDAWEALSKKGITPDGAYSKAKKSSASPNDDVKRTHSAKSLSNFNEHRRQKAEKSFINKLTPEEKQKAADMLAEMFDKGSYRVARSPESFGGIIMNGYKSQMETGRSGEGAAFNTKLRKEASDNMYGHGDLDNSEYEKYGYLGFADDGADQDDYGRPDLGVTYTLKKDRMQDRTTYSFGDSLNTRKSLSTPGYGGDKPTIEGMTSLGNENAVRDTLNVYDGYKRGEYDFDEMFKRAKDNADGSYVELQFHGPVTADDIERVTFSTKGDMIRAFTGMSNRSRVDVLKKLRGNNISVQYRDEGTHSFKDAMDWLEEYFL